MNSSNNSTNSNAKKHFTVYQLAVCALFTALMCVVGPMSIQIGPIPITLTNLIIYLSVYLLGMKGSAVSTLLYLLIGATGLGVFSGFQGGIGKLAGPTGGYLVGFIIMVLICGFVMEKSRCNAVITGLGMVAGTLVLYVFGTVWFVLQMQCEVWYALTVCVFPFIPFDIAKIVIATALGKALRAVLMKSHLLPDKMQNA